MLKMKSILVFFTVFYCSFLFAGESQSGRDTVATYNLSDVIITANKYFTPAIEVPNSVSVITRQDIEKRQNIYLSEVLRAEVGLSLAQQGGNGKLTRVFLRGANPHHTLFLVDGIEMNNPGSLSNAYDLSSFQTDNIERIEILRGPQSTLYGSDAMAGVISVFTSRGEGGIKLNLNSEYGSYKTLKTKAGLSGSLGAFHYLLNFSRIASDGISSSSEEYGNTEKDFSNIVSYYSRLGYDINENIMFDFIYNFSKTKAGLDQNAKLGDDPNFNYYQDEAIYKASATIRLFENSLEQNFSVTGIKVLNKTTDEIDEANPFTASENYFTGDRLKFEWQNIARLNKNNNLLFGFDFENEKGYSSYKDMWNSSEFPSSKADIMGIYIQEQAKFFQSLFVNAGMRYDKSNRFGSQTTFRVAPAYYFAQSSTKIKFTYGTGFKAPSLYYLLDPVYGNKDLKPEKSKGWDAGFEQFFLNKKIIFGVTYFRNDFTNLIGYDANFKTVNIDKAETKGFEFSLSLNPHKNLSITGNYTSSRNIDKSSSLTDGGKDLIRRPRNKGSVSVNYNIFDVNINLESIFSGKREDKEFMPDYTTRRVELKAYTLVNSAISYNINKYLKVAGRVENLFNEKYEEVLFYGTPGRSGYASVSISL